MSLKREIIEEINGLLDDCLSITTEIAMTRMSIAALLKMRDEIRERPLMVRV